MKKLFSLPSIILVIILFMATGLQAQPTTWEPGDPGLTHEKVTFNLYPNPSHGQVNMVIPNSTGNVYITVLNMNGAIVQHQQAYSKNETITISMNLSRVDPGYYIVRISNDVKDINTCRFTLQ